MLPWSRLTAVALLMLCCIQGYYSYISTKVLLSTSTTTTISTTTNVYAFEPVVLDGNTNRFNVYNPAPQIRQLTFFYLKKELKLNEQCLMKILTKYSWIMYLKVDTNLRPTIDVLKSFGFRDKDIRQLVQLCPCILGINHQWSLPEKLLSLQKMFSLSKLNLVKVVLAQPMLLTSSIGRNMEISRFFCDDVGLSEEGIKSLVLRYPRLPMTSATVLRSCWSVLTDVYGLSDKEAGQLVVKFPRVLSRDLLHEINDRVSFFSQELNMPPPFTHLQKVILRNPSILCVSVDIFIRPNLQILTEYLGLSEEEIHQMITVFPQVLSYNPTTLEYLCLQAMHLLTGLDDYKQMINDRQDAYDVVAVSNGGKISKEDAEDLDDGGFKIDAVTEHTIIGSGSSSSSSSNNHHNSLNSGSTDVVDKYTYIDLLEKFICIDNDSATSASATTCEVRHFNVSQGECLEISVPKAQKLLRTAPWLIAYRPERTRRFLGTLSTSLDMDVNSISKIVSIYPRMLCCSVDGKLKASLDTLSSAAAAYNSKNGIDNTNGNVKGMVRLVVDRYPLVLGASIEKLTKRLDEIVAHNVQWSVHIESDVKGGGSGGIVTALRRSEDQHVKWLEKINRATSSSTATTTS